MDKQPVNAQPAQDDPRVIIAQIAYVNHVQHCADSRKKRLEDLMSRKKAKKWDAAKKAKMVRRLMAANSELEQCALALTELVPKFEALKTKATPRVNNVAPFVPAPATSEVMSADDASFGG